MAKLIRPIVFSTVFVSGAALAFAACSKDHANGAGDNAKPSAPAVPEKKPAEPRTPKSRGPELLAVGVPAPGFSMQAHNGDTLTLSEMTGKPVVLYFYPKDETPG